MGRRKIEIKAIKDDRNRSVTFLKRKGGLFKKAHELSVLCSVDVAVIIFGSNKKLYEYSSSDIGEILTRYQYYGGANEHKGPADFTGKGKDMDDDDDEDGSGPSLHGSVEPQMMPPHPYPNQPFHQIRHQTPNASPPIPNGAFQHLPPQQRQHTPGPHPGSRPSSRNGNLPRRQSSNLVPTQQQQQHPQHQQNGFAFMPQPAIYNPQNPPPGGPHHGLPHHMQPGAPMQSPPLQGPPQGMPPQGPPPQYPNYGPPPPQQQQQPHPQQQQIAQMYMEEQRRASAPPPNFPPQQQERPPSRPSISPPQPQPQQVPQQPQPPPPQPQPQQQEQERQQEQQQQAPSQQMLQPVKRLSVKSRSIFTPIDESRSILSQHWASSTSNAEPSRSEPAPISNTRSQSLDVGRVKLNDSPPPPVRANTHKNRVSINSMDGITPPSRTNSAQLGGAKRPVLKVQIPEGDSEHESNTADSNSSPRSSTNAAGSNPRPNGRGSDSHASGVVLPPPSPSASALLSAGASGPPNPFARPHPVSQPSQNSNASNNMIDTPVSALPSRFMTNEFLPSPSSFYPEWNFRGNDSNTLPSPLNFATPVVGTGPSFLREDSGDRANTSNGKRKTPDADGSDGGGDQKRPKHEG